MPCFDLDAMSNSDTGKLLISFGYNPTLIDAFKSVGCRWSPDGRQTGGVCKVWWTDKPDVKELVNKAHLECSSAAEVHALLTAKRVDKIAASFKASSDFAVPVPEGNHPLTGQPFALMPFQRAGVEFAHRRDNALIADEMGLGKSVQAIGIINSTPESKKVLIVCPASLKVNWYRELRTWLVNKSLTVGIAQGGYWPDTDVVIINYDIISRHRETLDSFDWDLVVLDEAHYIKSPEAIRTKAIIGGKVGRGQKAQSFSPLKAKRRIALTGTPILNRPGELYSMLNWLDPREWASRFYFARRYCAGGWGMFDGASNLEELQLRLRQSLMIRRLKKDVLTELPPKMRSVIEYDVPELRIELEQEIQDAKAREQALAALRAAVEIAKASEDPKEYRQAIEALRHGLTVAFNEMAALRKRTAVAKIPHVIAHVKDILESSPDDKVIIFAHHRDVVDALHAAFVGKAVKLYGGLTSEEKDAAVQAFQTDDKCRVFVGSITAAGVGLTLTASSRVVFAELDWTPSNVTQCEDRAHRIGQKDTVLVQHIVLAGSLDATIARKLVAKQAVIDRALDEMDKLRADAVIPTDEAELDEVARIEDIDRDSQALSPSGVAQIIVALARLNDGTVELPSVDAIIVSRLAALPALTNRQAALGLKVCRKNLPDFRLTPAPN
jgi:SWI/SNF-related matrix-associated actin-dependent regulator 1 of chromatin subfamily A